MQQVVRMPVLLSFITPEIVQRPQAINTNIPTPVSFMRFATSYPSPKYQWDKVNSLGVVLDMGVGSGSEITFPIVVLGDEGYYRCVAFIEIDGLDPIITDSTIDK